MTGVTCNRSLMAGVVLGIALVVGGQALVNAPALANQPFMEAALGSLRQARENLNRAAADKAGHRERAIGLVNDAIGQVEAGIAAAR